jgi:hypothetical protein
MSATAPAGARRLGWIETGDLMTYPTRELFPHRPLFDEPAAPQPRAEMSAETAVLPRRIPGAPLPRITIAVVLATSGLAGPEWERAIRDVRAALDSAAAFHYEAHSCGAEGVRRTTWMAELPGEQAPRLREGVQRVAETLRGRARVTWAPCSPIDL